MNRGDAGKVKSEKQEVRSQGGCLHFRYKHKSLKRLVFFLFLFINKAKDFNLGARRVAQQLRTLPALPENLSCWHILWAAQNCT